MAQPFHAQVYAQEKMKAYVRKTTYTRVFLAAVLVIAQTGPGVVPDKQTLVRDRMEQQQQVGITNRYNHVEDPRKYCAEWKKPGAEKYILHEYEVQTDHF